MFVLCFVLLNLLKLLYILESSAPVMDRSWSEGQLWLANKIQLSIDQGEVLLGALRRLPLHPQMPNHLQNGCLLGFQPLAAGIDVIRAYESFFLYRRVCAT